MIITTDNYKWALDRLDSLYMNLDYLTSEEKAELIALTEDVRIYEDFVKYGNN